MSSIPITPNPGSIIEIALPDGVTITITGPPLQPDSTVPPVEVEVPVAPSYSKQEIKELLAGKLGVYPAGSVPSGLDPLALVQTPDGYVLQDAGGLQYPIVFSDNNQST